MRKIIIFLASLLFAVSQSTFAQITIFGSVVDDKDGSGIPGASIIVMGTTIGGITNSSGNFGLMNVPNDATLQVSFVGYKTVEVPVENQSRFNITLELDVQALGDVVVMANRNQRETVTTAMGIERDKETLTTAVHQVSGDEMRIRGVTNIVDGIGIADLPSVHGYWKDGSFTITHLRAVTSFSGSKPPLYVVDGIPLRRGEDGQPEISISLLNIEHVESVTVLPSANAAILYGSQGANGAIVITLKK